jgi:hypothetical protein
MSAAREHPEEWDEDFHQDRADMRRDIITYAGVTPDEYLATVLEGVRAHERRVEQQAEFWGPEEGEDG